MFLEILSEKPREKPREKNPKVSIDPFHFYCDVYWIESREKREFECTLNSICCFSELALGTQTSTSSINDGIFTPLRSNTGVGSIDFEKTYRMLILESQHSPLIPLAFSSTNAATGNEFKFKVASHVTYNPSPDSQIYLSGAFILSEEDGDKEVELISVIQNKRSRATRTPGEGLIEKAIEEGLIASQNRMSQPG